MSEHDPAIDLTLPRRALMEHRGPWFETTATDVGTDGKTYPVAWTAHCRCGAVTDEYEDHLLEAISLAAVVAAMGESFAAIDGRESREAGA